MAPAVNTARCYFTAELTAATELVGSRHTRVNHTREQQVAHAQPLEYAQTRWEAISDEEGRRVSSVLAHLFWFYCGKAKEERDPFPKGKHGKAIFCFVTILRNVQKKKKILSSARIAEGEGNVIHVLSLTLLHFVVVGVVFLMGFKISVPFKVEENSSRKAFTQRET